MNQGSRMSVCVGVEKMKKVKGKGMADAIWKKGGGGAVFVDKEGRETVFG